MDRYETRLFTPTLDESVGDNHPVRHLDEILRGMDWSDWTAQYNGRVGQPPIPSWVMAGVILYGLMRRIRSSRQLEYACKNHIDFIWLAEGRTIDHDTICAFRTKFKKPLKALFKQVGRVAMTMGLIKLVAVAFDGTRDFIVDCNVIGGPNEQNGLLPSVGRIEENFGRKPETMAADAGDGEDPRKVGGSPTARCSRRPRGGGEDRRGGPTGAFRSPRPPLLHLAIEQGHVRVRAERESPA